MSKKKVSVKTKPMKHEGGCCDGGCDGHLYEVCTGPSDYVYIIDLDEDDVMGIPMSGVQSLIDALEEFKKEVKK